MTRVSALRLHDPLDRGFASDNAAGVHPEVIAALAAANEGHQPAYGADLYTAHLGDLMRAHFGDDTTVHPVFNGTGANVVSLQAMLPRWGAVVTAGTAHIHTDEGGAPERVGGLKLLTVPAPDGKLTPELIDREAHGWGNVHRAQPLVVSISQSTELGTVYTPAEITALTEHAHGLGMRVHVDGARLANACAALGTSMRAITTDAGVDVVSFGGTKNGVLFGEAVLVLHQDAVLGVDYLRKLDMQLASKMRFISAQLIALLTSEIDGVPLWLASAQHANRMAGLLRETLEHDLVAGTVSGLEFTQPTQANALFATLPPGAADRLREQFRFYDWDTARREVRWMCSFDTTEADIEAFTAAIRVELG